MCAPISAGWLLCFFLGAEVVLERDGSVSSDVLSLALTMCRALSDAELKGSAGVAPSRRGVSSRQGADIALLLEVLYHLVETKKRNECPVAHETGFYLVP